MDFKTLYLSADGRIGQKDFWLGWLILLVAGIVLGMIPVIGMIVSILLIWPNIAVYAKRLHDFGKSAWLVLIPFVVNVIGLFLMGGAIFAAVGGAAMTGTDEAAATAAMAGAGSAGLIGLVLFVVNIGFLLWVGLSKGDPGENRFGPPRTTPLIGS
ncbi:DUF805 domain-containing protein [Brevundimonas sp. 2R-24]|uniref:DUF805 domain-containing protein n=1 Tax=Peiella sedimenti TaxID=3061083 RepID=A0ABT8SIB0_9CAUL|nr:DUF805 domain-containing protein [Caulobacteraceae bacterium XZ-24]